MVSSGTLIYCHSEHSLIFPVHYDQGNMSYCGIEKPILDHGISPGEKEAQENLLHQMLTTDPDKRPKNKDITNHVWIQWCNHYSILKSETEPRPNILALMRVLGCNTNNVVQSLQGEKYNKEVDGSIPLLREYVSPGTCVWLGHSRKSSIPWSYTFTLVESSVFTLWKSLEQAILPLGAAAQEPQNSVNPMKAEQCEKDM